MNLDEDAYCRVCCYLKQQGLSLDGFALSSDGIKYDLMKWDYTVPKPTEKELMSLDITVMKKTIELKAKGTSKLTIMTQEDIDLYMFQEGDFIFNKTLKLLFLFVDGVLTEI